MRKLITLLLLLPALLWADAPVIRRITLPYMAESERLEVTLQPGELVFDEADPSRVYIGDGETAGGVLVTPSIAPWDHVATQEIDMAGNTLRMDDLYTLTTANDLFAIQSGTANIITIDGGDVFGTIDSLEFTGAQYLLTVDVGANPTLPVIQHTTNLLTGIWTNTPIVTISEITSEQRVVTIDELLDENDEPLAVVYFRMILPAVAPRVDVFGDVFVTGAVVPADADTSRAAIGAQAQSDVLSALAALLLLDQQPGAYLYRQRLPERSAANQLTVHPFGIVIGGEVYTLSSPAVMDMDAAQSWDTTTPVDYTVPANRAGLDMYLYAVPGAEGSVELLLSADSSAPAGEAAYKKIGGMHGLCADVGVIADHPLSGMLAGDILPASIWDLRHRSSGDQAGTVYCPASKLWVDIYLASWDGNRLVSQYGAAITSGTTNPAFIWYNFVEEFGPLGKRLPYQHEFLQFAAGSNSNTSITGSTNRVTAGGWTDTAGRRMISNIGVEEACGHYWQWGADTAGQGRSNTWATENTTTIANTHDNLTSLSLGSSHGAPNRPRFGGAWLTGSNSGPRSSAWNASPLVRNSISGARGVAEPQK